MISLEETNEPCHYKGVCQSSLAVIIRDMTRIKVEDSVLEQVTGVDLNSVLVAMVREVEQRDASAQFLVRGRCQKIDIPIVLGQVTEI
jgi:hypothetical protein